MRRAERLVSWEMLLGPDAPMPSARAAAPVRAVGTLASVFEELAAIDDVDWLFKRATERSRDTIGLERVGIFLVDDAAGLLRGTWGTDRHRRTVDEHHVTCTLSDEGRNTFRRAADEGVPWTVVDGCPLVAHLPTETRVLGRGWVACTPIAAGRRPIAMMFNDAALSGMPLDPARQTLAAILCGFLGSLIEGPLRTPQRYRPTWAPRTTAVAAAIAKSLADDPSLSGSSLAKRHRMSVSRLARLFRAEFGMSLIDYRNRLRMDRFLALMDSRTSVDLLTNALDAGFGSYAQFHRIFRARYGKSPREHLRERRA
jgi:AraC-like DNA-binding protein